MRQRLSASQPVRPSLEPARRVEGEGTGTIREDKEEHEEDAVGAQDEEDKNEENAGTDQEEDQEGRKPKMLPSPVGPSRREYEEHMCTHIPYRGWCPHCVRGKAPNAQHRRHRGDEDEKVIETHAPARIGLDFWFMSKDEEEGNRNPLVIMVDKQSKQHVSYAIGSKSVSDWIVRLLCESLETWGYAGKPLIIRTDGEPAIKALRRSISGFRQDNTQPEDVPPGEHESMGFVECMVKSTRNQFKTMRDALEYKIGREIPMSAHVIQWMVRWASGALSRYQIGSDGRTAYERLKGRRCRIPICSFGERVLYKELHSKGRDRRNKAVCDWKYGVYLGLAFRSNSAIIGTRDGVIRAYAVKRRPVERRWSYEEVTGVTGTPGAPDPKKPGKSQVPIRVEARIEEEIQDEDVPEVAKEGARPRRWRIRKADFEKMGYTKGCEGCRHTQAGMKGTHRGHSEECRKRIEEELRKTPEGKRRIEEAQDRFTAHEERQMEAEQQDTSGGGDQKRPGVTHVQEASTAHRRLAEGKNTADEDDAEESVDTLAHIMAKVLMGADVTEIYSQERVTKMARRYGLKAGIAMDLVNGYDFNKIEDRKRAWTHLKEQKPLFLIGSPSCTEFSVVQNSNKRQVQ